jgi:hypothetical protein
MFQWLSHWWHNKPSDYSESPIQSLDSIDVFGQRNDGGVDLIIVDSNPADTSSETRRRLQLKIAGYLDAINSDAFQEEFNFPPAEKTRIIVVCRTEPNPKLAEWIEEWKPWVEGRRARVQLSVKVSV